jgi:SAM-dependent methyltransferase
VGWSAEDLEAARCCLCGEEGEPVHDLAPFRIVRCPRCTLHFTSPRLRPAALQRLYDDADYFEGGVYGRHRWSPAMVLQRVWTAGRLRLIERTTRRPPPGQRLLEIGCGYGRFLAAARRRGYATTGVELSATGVAHVRDVLGLDVHRGQLEDAPLEGSFDVIAMWDTIEHVPDPLVYLRTVASLLAEDGIAVFSTPYLTSLPARLLGGRWRALRPAEHIWHFTVETQALLAERVGLELRRVIRNPVDVANLTRLDSLVGIARHA